MTAPDWGSILQNACNDALLAYDLMPVYNADGKLVSTFCNVGLRRIAQRRGCQEFNNPEYSAESMIRVMKANESKKWTLTDSLTATLHALDGGLAVAFMNEERLEERHAHVAVVYPESMKFSGSLKKNVPMVANIGKGDMSKPLEDRKDGTRYRPNWKCKSSEAFPASKGEAEYFIWKEA